jgi:hypothetical protein
MQHIPPGTVVGFLAGRAEIAPVVTANELRETCEARHPSRLFNGAEVYAFAVSDKDAPRPEQVLGLNPVDQTQALFAAPQARMVVTRDLLDVFVFLARDDDDYDAVLQNLLAA